MRRAVRDEQKEDRRQAILEAAWRLFEQAAYGEITMSRVAAASGLAKGTLYLYFHTKEELFLAVLEAQLAIWFHTIDAGLRGVAQPCPPGAVAALIGEALRGQPGLLRLLAILHPVLEQNIDIAAARQFKHRLLERLTGTGALLEAALPALSPGEGGQTLLRVYALIIGLQQLADPSPAVRQALEEPRLAAFRIDFARELMIGLNALLGSAAGAGAVHPSL